MGVREGFVQVNVQLSPAILALVDQHRAVLGVSRSNMLRQAVYHYFNVRKHIEIDLTKEVGGGVVEGAEQVK